MLSEPAAVVPGRDLDDAGTARGLSALMAAAAGCIAPMASAVEALRASYALPGIFQPVRVNRRWLVFWSSTGLSPRSLARFLAIVVETRRIELPTFALRTRRSPS